MVPIVNNIITVIPGNFNIHFLASSTIVANSFNFENKKQILIIMKTCVKSKDNEKLFKYNYKFNIFKLIILNNIYLP